MHDDDLREGFDTLLAPIREAAPPPMQVIKRRVRRRRVRTAAASTAALAAVAAAVLSVHLTAGARPSAASPAATPASTGFTAPTSVPPSGSPIPGVRRSAVTYRVLSPVSSLALSADVSLVTISGSQQRTVSVTEQIQYSQAPPSFSRSLRGGTLSLGYTCPAEPDCGVSYQIQVPRDTAVSVTLQTGSITLSRLAGPVTASTGTGAISATGLSGRTVRLRTGTGEITAGFTSPPATLQATAQTGAINIGVPGTGPYNVTARAFAYVVNVNISPSSPYAITAQAGTGVITIVPGTPANSLSAAMQGGVNDYCTGPQCVSGS
jgi:hypothetical protein